MEKSNQSVERDIKATETIIANLEKDLKGFLNEKGELKEGSPKSHVAFAFMLAHHKKHLNKLLKV